MLEIASPLTACTAAPPTGSALGLASSAPRALMQIASWAGFEEALAPVLTRLGLQGLGDYRKARQAGDVTCFRIAPDRLLLAHRDPLALSASVEVLDPARAASLDLTHARWIITISGREAPALLARLLPLDLSPGVFPVGSFAQSGLHHVGVLLHHRADARYDLYVPVTWAQSLWTLICESAEPFGHQPEREAP